MNEQNEAREEIFAKHISNNGFVSTICKEFINSIVKRQPNLKIGKRNLNTLHKRRCINGKNAPEKMLTIDRHQENEN